MPVDFDPALEVAIIVRQAYAAAERRVRERQLGEAFTNLPERRCDDQPIER